MCDHCATLPQTLGLKVRSNWEWALAKFVVGTKFLRILFVKTQVLQESLYQIKTQICFINFQKVGDFESLLPNMGCLAQFVIMSFTQMRKVQNHFCHTLLPIHQMKDIWHQHIF